MIQKQISYERLFDKRQARDLIKTKLTNYGSNPIEDKTVLDILSILVTRNSRTSTSAIIEMLADRQSLQETAEEIVIKLLQLTSINLLTMSTDSKKRLYFQSNFSLDTDTLDLLKQYQYKIPMLVEPLPLNQKDNNKGNGYYLNGSDSLILNNHHTKDIDHKVLERFNSIPLTINTNLLNTIPNSWNNMDKEETKENFDRFQRVSAKASAILVSNGNKFYFTHKYDKRGRIYCCGYQLNYQGNSFAKATIELFNKEEVSEEIDFF